ncbi:MAG: winged helix-turn-helix domain-containing protein [Candidatus Eremiobacteraeota bacterium]|nr:winged helix-turn-helix domain-containing protein [Candidatus Eremiobacteraeota bacterium]
MSVYEFGPFQLDVEQLLLMRGGEPVALGPKVVETLLALVESPGDVLAKGVLLDRIWPEGFVDEASLAQNVHVLRKTFRRHGTTDPIETIPRRGYRFTAAVRRLSALPVREIPAIATREDRMPMRRIAAALMSAAFVAASVVLVASDGFGHRAHARPAHSDDVAQLYQIGRYYWNLRTRDGVRKSLGYFERVVDGDPRDARGYAALADANVAMGDYCYGTHQPAVYFARARAYATTALALDPSSAEAHATLGFLALDRDDATVARVELQRAIALDPAYAPARAWYGIALIADGRASEGVRQLRTAADLDPLAVTATAWLASHAYASRRFGAAITYARQALELAPQRTDALMTLGVAYEARGDIDHAVAAFERYGAVDAYYRPEAAALLARAYALGHRPREAREQLAFARAHPRELYPGDLAAAVTAVGDRHGAIDALRLRGHRMGTENAARLYVTI